MKIIQKGNAVSKGIGIGKAYLYKQYTPRIVESKIDNDLVPQELLNYQKTKFQAETEIQGIQSFLAQKNDEKAKIFQAHLDILNDIAIAEEVEAKVKEDLYTYEYAVHLAYEMFIEMLSEVDDVLIKERVADLKDVKNRLLRIASGVAEANLSRLTEPSIVIAQDLYPSDTATLDRTYVQAIVTEIGGVTSHTAIIAKSYEIPAVLGIDQILDEIKHGELVIVDAISNKIIISPDEVTLNTYLKKQQDFIAKREVTKKYLSQKPVTKDKVKVEVSINIGSANKEELDFEQYVDGVGLFRSEFLYMEETEMPSEEKQFEIYKKALSKFGDKPVILRTLDIGGDKELSYLEMPKEENPFLGNRAIRLCFDHMDLFKTQLRAALRASVYGNLWLMFPMVGSMDDVYNIKKVIEDVKKELDLKKQAFNPNFKTGVMIEIPSIIMVADHVAKEVDFASIGTNDLCQYLSAVDRMNPMVSKYYQSYSPSMFRMMKLAIDAFNHEHKPISVCGELGGDLVAAPVLLGLGMRKLSMSKTSVPAIKKVIINHEMKQFEAVSKHILTLKTEAEVINYVKSQLNLED